MWLLCCLFSNLRRQRDPFVGLMAFCQERPSRLARHACWLTRVILRSRLCTSRARKLFFSEDEFFSGRVWGCIPPSPPLARPPLCRVRLIATSTQRARAWIGGKMCACGIHVFRVKLSPLVKLTHPFMQSICVMGCLVDTSMHVEVCI